MHPPTLPATDLSRAITCDPLICTPDTSVATAIAQMAAAYPGAGAAPGRQHAAVRASCVLVVAKGALQGVLTEGDMLQLAAGGRPLNELACGAVARPPLSIRRSALRGPRHALALLQQHQARHLVVLDADDLVVGLLAHPTLIESVEPALSLPAENPWPGHDDEQPMANGRHPSALPAVGLQGHAYAQSLLDIIHAARDLIASADTTGRIAFMNRAGREMLGIPAEAPIEQSYIADYHTPAMAESITREAIPHAIAYGFWEGETVFRRRDGSNLPAWQVIVPHRRPDGTVSHISTIARDLSERRGAEQATRESEERLRLALKAANQGLYDLNIQTGEAVVTPEYATMLGYDPATFRETNASWIERIHPDDAERVGTIFSAYVTGIIDDYSAEFRQRTRQGSWKWILSTGKILAWDAAGRPLRMLGTHTDITARKEIEQALLRLNQELEQRVAERTADLQASEARLRKSEAHLLAAQRIALLGSWELDLQTRVITWSSEVFRIFNRDQNLGPLTLDAIREVIHPDDRETQHLAVAQAIAQAQPYAIDLRLIRPDGELRYTQARGEPVHNQQGQLVGLVGTIVDITERRHAEEQIRSLANRLSLAVKSAAIGTWDWDVVENVLTWDQRMYELYGVAPANFTRAYETWAQGLHPADRAAAEAAITMALHGEQEFDTEFRVVHPDGAIRTIKANGLVQRSPEGVPLRMIGVNQDITERKQAEAQLREAGTQLLAANRELQSFAYSVSHDLRAPLRAIDGFSQALLDDYGPQLNAEAQGYLRRIRGGVQRMGALIDDLLRLSRVTRAEMHYSRVSLSEQIQRIVAELRESQPERQVTVVIAPGVQVWADQSLMHVALSNLLANAWKFTSHHAQAQIEFGLRQAESAIVYFVRDDGAGFDPAYANKLFGVFQRLHDTDEFPGTGIGLATVQRVINRHGGTVWAEGAVEQGATFFFTLHGSDLPKEHLHHVTPRTTNSPRRG